MFETVIDAERAARSDLCTYCETAPAGDFDLCQYDLEINGVETECACCNDCRETCKDNI